MKVLHYFLGFPPYRTGGLTKFVIDLMKQQTESGYEVEALWPGEMLFAKRVKIKKRNPIDDVNSYELVNPLPIPLDEGINQIEEFIKECDKQVFIDFLSLNRPDVIHIHTLMGLYKEFIEAANELNIRTVFTTHDYFGLCPMVTMYKDGAVCSSDNNCLDCVRCNQNALSVRKIKILQSVLYRKVKNWSLVKWLRSKHRTKFFDEEQMHNDLQYSSAESENMQKQYQKLRRYYIEILENISCIHYNSSVAKDVYSKLFTPQNSVVISITHRDIKDNRFLNNKIRHNKLIFLYLAPLKNYKGFGLLIDAFDRLWKTRPGEFELHVYNSSTKLRPYMIVHEHGFTQNELSNIMSSADMLIAPSIWKETFGFTVLEALSNGVPVIVSSNVGAKDVIPKNGGIILEDISAEKLYNAILKISIKDISQMRERILKDMKIKTMYELMLQLESECYN